MVYTNLKDIHRYFILHPYFQQAVNYLTTNNFENIKDGKYDLINEELFSIVSSPEDSEANETKLEAHKKYIDIHFIFKGTETFGVKAISKCHNPIGSFDETKDVLFYDDKDYDTLTLTENDCVIVYPEDAHAPVLQTSGLKKVVVKIMLNVKTTN
jgi:biofilm protein TabA